jgi:hypothetical protein
VPANRLAERRAFGILAVGKVSVVVRGPIVCRRSRKLRRKVNVSHGTVPLWDNRDEVAPDAGPYQIHQVDALDWLLHAEPCSVHAVVTDPPYGLLEYSPDQLEKMRNGQ